MKEEFINNELWILTIGAGFQRSNVYPNDFPEKDKTAFKERLKTIIDNITLEYKVKTISENEHISNIWKIVNDISKSYTINLNFGIAQKLLNLHLKYQWCMGKLHATPPHFTVDRMIQEKLNALAVKKKMNPKEVKPWTKFKDETEYLKIIRFAEKVRDSSKEHEDMSLVELELELFNRR